MPILNPNEIKNIHTIPIHLFRVNLDLNMERDAVAHSPMTKCDKLNVKIKYY